MRSITNLTRPAEPFERRQRPFQRRRSTIAAVAASWEGYVTRPVWGCLVYLTVSHTATMRLDGQVLDFGFEILVPEPGDPPAVFAQRMDERLVACHRQAQILAGHDLAPHLVRLRALATSSRLPGVEDVRQSWSDRAAKGRGIAAMIDTAHDLEPSASSHGDRLALIDASDLTDLAALATHAGLRGVPATGPPAFATVPTPTTENASASRQALTVTLAVALLAARHTGCYKWNAPIDLHQVVSEAV